MFTILRSGKTCGRLHISETYEKEGSAEIQGEGEEWYAKGLGLVYYRKAYDKGRLVLEYRLKDVFPMAELERRRSMQQEAGQSAQN